MQHVQEVRGFVARVRPVLVSAAVFSLFVNLLMLVPALYMLQVYDRVLTSRNVDTLLLLTLLVLAFYGVLAVLEWVRSRLLVNAGIELDSLLSPRLFDAFVRHQPRSRGDTSAGAFADASTLRSFLTGQGLFALFDAPWAPVFIVVIYLIHPALAAVALVGAVLLTLLAWISQRVTRQSLEQATALNGLALASASACGRNHEAILAMGMLGALRRRWLQAQQQAVAFQSDAARKAGLLASASRLIRLVQQAAILGVGALYVIQGELSPGGLIAASILMGRALAPLDQAIASWRQFSGAHAAYQRIEMLLARHPVEQPRLELPAPEGRVSVERLTMVPAGAESPVLFNIDVEIAAGSVVGVIGPSGSGKSTLARALTGAWVPARGHVRLDGADLGDWNPEQLSRHIGYLPQSIELLDGTVAENIGRFAELDAESVVDAARTAGVHEMVMRLPQGYETQVGPEGRNLSGGQRQRLGLARALYGRPRFVVLDEPNSNLDEQGEAALMNAIAAMKAWGATVAVITHRRPILAATDTLLVLRDGRLVLQGGTAAVLLALAGAPARPLEVVK